MLGMAPGAPAPHSCTMDGSTRPTPARALSGTGPIQDDAAFRDAARILARAEADETAANQARELHRAKALTPMEPDLRIAPVLDHDECLYAVRRHAVLDRRQALGPIAPSGIAGDLYLTSRRLVLLGRRPLSFDLEDIEEVLLSGERLLLVMHDGEGASLHVAQPRLLRVEIAAARQCARG